MVIILASYVAGGVITFFLIAILRGRSILHSFSSPVSVLVAVAAWPFVLTALMGCVVLWWIFDVLDLLFYTVSTYFRGDK